MKLHVQFQQVRAPQPWLYRAVHNLAVDHQRRASKIVLMGDSANEGESPVNDASDSQPLPDEQIARWESIGLVRLVLETLDERSRELIRLRFNEELSYKEIERAHGADGRPCRLPAAPRAEGDGGGTGENGGRAMSARSFSHPAGGSL